jgi:hypothetical protein
MAFQPKYWKKVVRDLCSTTIRLKSHQTGLKTAGMTLSSYHAIARLLILQNLEQLTPSSLSYQIC